MIRDDEDELDLNLQEDNKIEELFIPHQIFINHVDTFISKYTASYLSDQIKAVRKETTFDEVDEEEVPTEENENIEQILPIGKNYQIIGTLKWAFHKPTEDIYKVIKSTDEKFDKEVLKCGFFIFDATKNMDVIVDAKKVLQILQDKLESVQQIGPKTYAQYDEDRVFILISSVFTWALTKPIDPEDPETPITEADFRKRRCHPNYKQLIDFEREVISVGKKFKDKLKTYVICSGIIYGMQEEDLLLLFKLAWQNETLPLFKPGNNYIPLINIKDLLKVIHAIIDTTPKKKYILAVEQTPCNLKHIVKALNKFMGNGKINLIEPMEAYLLTNVTQRDYECMTLNLRMEPAFIVDELEIEWQNELNLVENMPAIINEFKSTRKLRPINIILHGPPAVGKTALARYISENYDNHYVSIKSMIEATLANLREKIENEKIKIKMREDQNKQEGAEEGNEEEEDDEEVDIEDIEQQLHDIENVVLYTENGRLPDEDITRMMKAYISQNFIQNQGYVLDGYPKSTKQAMELFGGDSDQGGEEEEEEGEDEEGGEATLKLKILPDCVISLEATDDFLCRRIMAKPESEIQGTHYTEEHMLRRLETYRLNNTEDNTMLNYFNEREIHPIVIDVMKLQKLEVLFSTVTPYIGSLNTFEPTEEDEKECDMLEMQRQQLLVEEEEIKKQILEKKAQEEYEKQMEEWSNLLDELQMEEERLLVAQSEPLRNYLMKFVFPTLTKGLLEVAKIKPTDPVDFLAEYLFKENPEGRMFDPSYTRTGELIERKFREQSEF